MDAVVVDDDFAVDGEAGAVVGGESELELAIYRDLNGAGEADAELAADGFPGDLW